MDMYPEFCEYFWSNLEITFNLRDVCYIFYISPVYHDQVETVDIIQIEMSDIIINSKVTWILTSVNKMKNFKYMLLVKTKLFKILRALIFYFHELIVDVCDVKLVKEIADVNPLSLYLEPGYAQRDDLFSFNLRGLKCL